jgi:hypothetical protein
VPPCHRRSQVPTRRRGFSAIDPSNTETPSALRDPRMVSRSAVMALAPILSNESRTTPSTDFTFERRRSLHRPESARDSPATLVGSDGSSRSTGLHAGGCCTNGFCYRSPITPYPPPRRLPMRRVSRRCAAAGPTPEGDGASPCTDRPLVSRRGSVRIGSRLTPLPELRSCLSPAWLRHGRSPPWDRRAGMFPRAHCGKVSTSGALLPRRRVASGSGRPPAPRAPSRASIAMKSRTPSNDREPA